MITMNLYENFYIGIFNLANHKVFVEKYRPDVHVDQQYFIHGNYNDITHTLETTIDFTNKLLNININKSEVLHMLSFDQVRPFSINGREYNGKRINNYFYNIKENDCGTSYDKSMYEWVDIDILFKDKKTFTKDVFEEFLSKNNLKSKAPTSPTPLQN